MYKEIEEGVILFNDLDFFAAHDFFEALWIDADPDDRLFYQGMVQISVGGYHLLNGNYKGSRSQYKKGTEKLKNYLPGYKGIELEFLLQKIDNVIRSLESHLSKSTNRINIDIIPKIEKI